MGKIVDALRIARGDVPELVLRSLDGPADDRPSNGSTPATPKVETPPLDRSWLPPRIPDGSQLDAAVGAPSVAGAGIAASEPPEPAALIAAAVADSPLIRVRPLLMRISNSAPLLSSKSEHPLAAEQYRIVRTGILQHPSAPSMLVVSSPCIGDGKTVTAVNLAAAFAMKSEEQVLLIDADLRCSAVHTYLRVPRTPGLAEVLAGKCSLEEAIFRVGQIPGLCVLPAGEPSGNPSELLGSSRWLALAKTVRQRFQRVIVDCPPVEAVADFDLIAAACDGVILIIRPDFTNRTLCLRALTKTRKKLCGVVVNGSKDRALLKQYLSNYHAYSRTEKDKK